MRPLRLAPLFSGGGFLFIYGNHQIAYRPNFFFGCLYVVVIRLHRPIDIVQRALNLFQPASLLQNNRHQTEQNDIGLYKLDL